MRRFLIAAGAGVLVLVLLFAFVSWHRDHWYAQDFKADFAQRLGKAIDPSTIRLVELSSGGRLVCAASIGGGAGRQPIYGLRYMVSAFGSSVDELATPEHANAADEGYLKTACL